MNNTGPPKTGVNPCVLAGEGEGGGQVVPASYNPRVKVHIFPRTYSQKHYSNLIKLRRQLMDHQNKVYVRRHICYTRKYEYVDQ